jgi:hypothetical protein
MVISPLGFFPNPYVGWICKIAVSEQEKELDALLTEEQYNEFLESQHDEEALEEAEEQSDQKNR